MSFNEQIRVKHACNFWDIDSSGNSWRMILRARESPSFLPSCVLFLSVTPSPLSLSLFVQTFWFYFSLVNKFVNLHVLGTDIPVLFKVLNLTRRELKSWHKECGNNSNIVISYGPCKEELKRIWLEGLSRVGDFCVFVISFLSNMIELLRIFQAFTFALTNTNIWLILGRAKT